MNTAERFIRSVEVIDPGGIDPGTFPWTLPAVSALADGLELDPRVTFLVGENGSGKSTLIEAFAVAAGLNPEEDRETSPTRPTTPTRRSGDPCG